MPPTKQFSRPGIVSKARQYLTIFIPLKKPYRIEYKGVVGEEGDPKLFHFTVGHKKPVHKLVLCKPLPHKPSTMPKGTYIQSRHLHSTQLVIRILLVQIQSCYTVMMQPSTESSQLAFQKYFKKAPGIKEQKLGRSAPHPNPRSQKHLLKVLMFFPLRGPTQQQTAKAESRTDQQITVFTLCLET